MEAIIFSLLLMLSNTNLVLPSANHQPIDQNPQQHTSIPENEQGYTDDTLVECSSGGGKIITMDVEGI